ncbi:MAG: hypothetical protein GWN58_59285, partial [Anaerolineae bacterium]|nr:hypothetical protein [Anaerolineae bacterium]
MGDASDIRWQPDCVVLLRDGVVTEYDDPDDAFADADTAGDVILIPPGEWTLTTGYSLTDVSIVGLGGGPGDCVLKSTMSSSTTLLDMNGSCTLFNFTIDWQIASSSGTTHYALKLGVSCQTYFVNIDLEIASGSSHAQGMQTTGITRQCVVHVTTDSGNSTGIDAAGNEVMQDCEGVATTDSGIAKGLMANDIPEKLPVKDCVGYGKTTGTGTAYGLFFGGFPISEVHIGDSWFTGDTYDVGGIKSEAHFNSVKYETTNLTDGATIVHEAGDRAGKGRADTITGQWVFEALAGLAFKDATELTIAGGV